MNLVRGWIGACGIAAAHVMSVRLNTGWYFTLLAGISLISFPMLFLEITFGPRVRAKRAERRAASISSASTTLSNSVSTSPISTVKVKKIESV